MRLSTGQSPARRYLAVLTALPPVIVSRCPNSPAYPAAMCCCAAPPQAFAVALQFGSNFGQICFAWSMFALLISCQSADQLVSPAHTSALGECGDRSSPTIDAFIRLNCFPLVCKRICISAGRSMNKRLNSHLNFGSIPNHLHRCSSARSPPLRPQVNLCLF